MTDREAARELSWMILEHFAGLKNPPVDHLVDAVAGRARELFGMTPEERAVIEAALSCVPEAITRYELSPKLERAIRALRASREPKPRYVVQEDQLGLHPYRVVEPGDIRNMAVARCLTRDIAERIAAALNRSEP